jgi:hypothetical protein
MNNQPQSVELEEPKGSCPVCDTILDIGKRNTFRLVLAAL